MEQNGQERTAIVNLIKEAVLKSEEYAKVVETALVLKAYSMQKESIEDSHPSTDNEVIYNNQIRIAFEHADYQHYKAQRNYREGAHLIIRKVLDEHIGKGAYTDYDCAMLHLEVLKLISFN